MIRKGDIQLISIDSFKGLAGIEVNWDPSANLCTAKKGNVTVIFKADSDIALVNGKENHTGVVSPIVSGKLFVPLKFTAEVFGGKVEYKTEVIQTDISIE